MMATIIRRYGSVLRLAVESILGEFSANVLVE
jgi:hypothetical protein